jgi:hypothetical protein
MKSNSAAPFLLCEDGKYRNKYGDIACPHKRKRHACRDCSGCEHGRLRAQCVECGGIQICEHKRIRYRCRECGGGSFCEHNNRRVRCRTCKGSEFCKHNKLRFCCYICSLPGALRACKYSAKTRGLIFSLTDSEVFSMVQSRCHFCGSSKDVGVDRIDSSVGYESDNVQPCCKVCNQAKSNRSDSEFISMCRTVAKLHPESLN